VASNIQAGDRVRVTVKSRVPGYAVGETARAVASPTLYVSIGAYE
jgi:hypothetical protein